MRKFLVITMAIAMLACSVVGVSAYEANADGFVTIDNVEVQGKTLTGEYGLVVIKGLDTEILNLNDVENILYIDQTTASENKVSFGEIGLRNAGTFTGATAYIGGENLGTAEKIGNITPKAVQSVTLDKETATVAEGKTIKLTATVAPDDAVNKTVTWTSSDETIATVAQDGTVTGVKESATPVTITATSGTVSDTCAVTVTAASSEPDRMPGDVNDSNSVTMFDASLVAKAVVTQDFTSINVSNADVNESNSVTMFDASLIAKAVVTQDFTTLK